ncbi:MAG: glycosyl transferase family 2 [Flavobacteriaceae bacterium]|nr:glycosyl transferase family 2 [Flavobacteriaceae bacterium]
MVLLYLLGIVALGNIAYYFLFSKFTFLKAEEQKQAPTHPVSLIVCAKNEEDNLRENIPLWLSQDYPNFELILINDASIDATPEIMEAFAEKDDRIKMVHVKNNEAFWANKKYALTLGIKRAVNTTLIFTDADCKPASTAWLGQMVARFEDDVQLVLGYGAYTKQPGLLNKIIRFETAITGIQYFSYAKAGMPYMGVGRNLGYTSDLFYEKKGFMSHIKVPSGDDDLFVNEAATTTNTAICYAENAFTYSLPKKTWKEWVHQKRRHYTTAQLYRTKHKLALSFYFIFNLLFWPMALAALLFSDWRLALPVILVRLALQFFVVGKGLKKLREPDLVMLLPLLEVFLIFIQLSIFISGNKAKNSRWK